MSYICYFLQSDADATCLRTYVGITNNSKRRLRQHNGEIKGGARSTRSMRPVRYFLTIRGLTKSRALSIEKTIHNKRRKNRKFSGWVGCLLMITFLVDANLISANSVDIHG